MPELIVIVTVVVFVVIIGAGQAFAARQRPVPSALRDWARARGWIWGGDRGGPWLQYLPWGDAWRGVRGQAGGASGEHRVTVADFFFTTYTPGDPDDDLQGTLITEHCLTVVVVTLADWHPAVELRFRHRGEPGTGGTDSEEADAAGPSARYLTGAGEFDRRYLISAESAATAALVTGRVVNATLDRRLPPGRSGETC